MALKFKPGDKVILNAPQDGLGSGSTGQIVNYNDYAGSYNIIIDTIDPSSESGPRVGGTWEIPTANLEPYTPTAPRPKVEFDSVIIEDSKRDQIKEALEQVNQADLIFNVWGFGETMEKGKGVSMLFYGPPGTGKTLMAQAISDHLGYKLKVVGTADIESSAPGESERNIRKIFKEAKGTETVLLFDECDSLIYNRANVGAILGAQINELLSQIEKYEGVTLFTTNRLGTLDEAMNRRLALKLEFAMPTEEQRVEIWKRMFPANAPISKNISWKKLAKVEVAGGYIKNTVLRAARMAAIQKLPDDQKKITETHLIKALTLEAQSMIEFDKARKTEEEPRVVRRYVENQVRGW